MSHQVLLELASVLGRLSLLSIGSSATILGQMQRDVVSHGWMTPAQFTQAFGLAQGTPGSGSLVVVAVGYRAAGLAGALVAFGAFYIPTFLLAVAVTAVWHRVRASRWPNAVRTALLPVAMGLIVAAVYSLSRSTVQTLPELALIAVIVIANLRTRLPMVALMGGAMAAGAVFLR